MPMKMDRVTSGRSLLSPYMSSMSSESFSSLTTPTDRNRSALEIA